MDKNRLTFCNNINNNAIYLWHSWTQRHKKVRGNTDAQVQFEQKRTLWTNISKTFPCFFCCWWLTLQLSQVVRPLLAPSSAFRMARHGRMISIQHFEPMPHGQPWYLHTQTIDRFQLFFFFFIWEGRVHHTPHKTLRFLSSTVAGPWERIGHEVGPITPLTFTKILRFVKGRRWSICWLEGAEVSCQSWGFGLNIKSLSLLFRQNGPF